MSFAAAIQSFFQIALQISQRKKLQQSDAKVCMNESLFSFFSSV